MQALHWLAVATIMLSTACASSGVGIENACDGAGGDAASRAELSREESAVAVALLAHTEDEWALCSGVLVAPRMVLTAAHCVHNRADWSIDVFFTADLLSGGPSISVASRSEHPIQDLAALVLDDDAPIDSELLPWTGELLGSEHVQSLRVIGYGGPRDDVTRCLRVAERAQDLTLDPHRGDGTRYAILLEGRAWPGDSGGPVMFEQAGASILVGVHSGTTAGEVSNGSLTFAERLGQADPWVVEAMGSAPTEIP